MKKICQKCGISKVVRQNRCRPCLNAYARQNYEKNFKAEPHEYKQRALSCNVLAIAKDIRSKTDIRKSLSAKFGAQPERKYDANDIRKPVSGAAK